MEFRKKVLAYVKDGMASGELSKTQGNDIVQVMIEYKHTTKAGPILRCRLFPRFHLEPRHPTADASQYACNFCVSTWPDGSACCAHVACQPDPTAILAEC